MSLSWERMPLDLFSCFCVCVCVCQWLAVSVWTGCLSVWMCAWAASCLTAHCRVLVIIHSSFLHFSVCDGLTVSPSSLGSLHDSTVCAVPLLLWWRIFIFQSPLVSGSLSLLYSTWNSLLTFFSPCSTRFNHQWLCQIKGEYFLLRSLQNYLV